MNVSHSARSAIRRTGVPQHVVRRITELGYVTFPMPEVLLPTVLLGAALFESRSLFSSGWRVVSPARDFKALMLVSNRLSSGQPIPVGDGLAVTSDDAFWLPAGAASPVRSGAVLLLPVGQWVADCAAQAEEQLSA